MQLSSFKTYVKYDFKRTDKDTELIQAYNDMINWVSLQLPNSGYKFQSYITTTAGVEDYALPSNLIHLLHPIRLLEGSATGDDGWPLTHLEKEQFDFYQPNPNRTSPETAEPWAYTIYSKSILLHPIPDLGTYILEINWTKRITAQSLDADTSYLGSEWDEVLKWGTLERLYAGLGLYDEAQYWGSKYHTADDEPIGLCRKLLDIERDRELPILGQVVNNDL